MPRWTEENLRDYERRQARGKESGPCPGPEKLTLLDCESKTPRLEEAVRRQFRVTINFRMSDNRRRDIDNAACAIIDAIVAARRCLAAYSGDNPDGQKGQTRRRGRGNPD